MLQAAMGRTAYLAWSKALALQLAVTQGVDVYP
jgi:hypothetical protein